MAHTQLSQMKYRGGGEEVSNLIRMMNLTPASPTEAVCNAPGTAHKGRMLTNCPQDSPALPDSSFKDCIDQSLPAPLQTSQVEHEVRQGLQVDGGRNTNAGKRVKVERPTAWPVQRSGSTQPRSLHIPERTRTGPEVDLGSESSDPTNLLVAWSQSSPSVEPVVVLRHDASSHAQPELQQSRVIESIKTPSPSSVIPVLEKLLSSSDKSHPGSDTCSSSSSAEHSDPTQSDEQMKGDCVDATVVRRTFSRLQESLQGFLFGHSTKQLEDFLVKIVSKPRDFGIYINNQFNPSPEEGVMRYRKGKEFTVKKTIHHSEHKHCGVFLCVDNHSQQQFVLKTIMMHNKRLVGIEFLTQHNKAFLPKIYGVYKERGVIHIFEEFVEGGTLLTCEWNLAEVRQFAETLLSAFHYLHTHDLAHCDVKLMNLMVRDPLDPQSLVLIDFESAKHPQYAFHKGGHTVTYLPPWYDRILDLNSYDPVLKTADLWAIACVIIFFLLPSERCDVQERKWGVWNQALDDIKSKCDRCRDSATHSKKYCDDCKKNVMLHIKSHGHRILEIHLGHLMDSNIDDPDWLALKNVLKYLTDTENIGEKHVNIALSLVRDPAESQSTLSVKCSSTS